MGLVRTLTANCDAHDCTAFQELDPDATQPHRQLVEMGWSLKNLPNDIATFCPEHRDRGE